MTVQKKIRSHQDVVNCFEELSFYNMYIEKPKIKRLKNIDSLSELPFHEELSVIKTDHEFKGYAVSYKVEFLEKKDLLIQLEANKSIVKNLFNVLLDETKGFK